MVEGVKGVKLASIEVVEGVKGVKLASMLPGIYKNSTKNGQFPALVDLKIAENAVFTQKLIKYAPMMFFEDYMNIKKNCY